MAWTQEDADALRRAIANGARRVQVNGEMVEYRSLAEMRQALAMIEADLAGGPVPGFRTVYPKTGRGL